MARSKQSEEYAKNRKCNWATVVYPTKDFYYKYLKDHELSWIIYSYSMDIKKPIPYKSSINVETYLEGIKKFYACRVYKVYNEKNELVSEGKIIFLLIDLEKRRAVRIPMEYCELINMSDTGEVELKSTKVEKSIREDLE